MGFLVSETLPQSKSKTLMELMKHPTLGNCPRVATWMRGFFDEVGDLWWSNGPLTSPPRGAPRDPGAGTYVLCIRVQKSKWSLGRIHYDDQARTGTTNWARWPTLKQI